MQWMTVPSWMDVRAPIRMSPWSPRSTADGQTLDSGPIVDAADHHRVGVDVGGGIDVGFAVAEGVEGHRPILPNRPRSARAAGYRPCRARIAAAASPVAAAGRRNDVSGTGRAKRCRVIALARVNSRSPSAPWIRPKPDSPTPPNGSSGTRGERDHRVHRRHAGTHPPGQLHRPRPCRRRRRPARSRWRWPARPPRRRRATLVTVSVGPNVSSVFAAVVGGHVDEHDRVDERRMDALAPADDGAGRPRPARR